MKAILYQDLRLQENRGKGFKIWKGCHILSCALAVASGLVNYYFLLRTMGVFGDACVLYPVQLAFNTTTVNQTSINTATVNHTSINTATVNHTSINTATVNHTRINETLDDEMNANQMILFSAILTLIYLQRALGLILIFIQHMIAYPNSTLEVATLDAARSRWVRQSRCDLSLYTPILSVVFGLVWCTFFTMCPGGGYRKSGLRKPWKILWPALLFSLCFSVFSGIVFLNTNGGLHALCEAFAPVTNTTTCSEIDAHVVNEGSWSVHVLIALTRGGACGLWAAWTCAAALLLSRCMAAPDFKLIQYSVHLHDPHQKILKTSPGRVGTATKSGIVRHQSPNEDSVISATTFSTELVTAAIEHTPS